MIDTKSLRERLLKEFGIEQLAEAEQEKLIEGGAQNLIEALLLSVMRKLPIEAVDEFEQMVEKGDGGAIERIMRAHIPKLDLYLEGEIRAEIVHLKRLQKEALKSQ